MQALIVDDEPIIRNGIRNAVPWEQFGIGEVLTAASGREALSIFREKEPSLLITDIRMRGMTGIELIGQIREKNTDTRIIVLTGYDEFDYARDCIRLDVQDFLLKPVDENLLVASVRKQAQEIVTAQNAAVSQVYMRRITGTSEQQRLEEWMRKLLGQEEVGETVELLCGKYGFPPHTGLHAAILQPSFQQTGIRSGEDCSLSLLTIKNLAIGHLDAKKRGITFSDRSGQIVLCLFEREQPDALDRDLSVLTKLVREECGVNLRIFLGTKASGFARLAISYNEAAYLMDKEKNESGALVRPTGGDERLRLFRDVYAELKSRIGDAVGGAEQILGAFDTFTKACGTFNISDQYVRRCCFEMAATVYFAYCEEAGESGGQRLNALSTSLLSIDRQGCFAMTRSFITNLCASDEAGISSRIADIKTYIKEHLDEDITVSGLADIFYLNPNYFSRMFKRVTGEGCNEYIARKRTEKACALLSATDMKIAAIAAEIGYRDTNYFSLVFKKQKGCTPKQYRDRKRTG